MKDVYIIEKFKIFMKIIGVLLLIILLFGGILYFVPLFTAMGVAKVLAMFSIYVPIKIMFWTVYLVVIINWISIAIFTAVLNMLTDLIK